MNPFSYISSLTWDTGIVSAVGILAAYSLIFRRDRSLALLISVYVGFLVAEFWGLQLSELLTGQRVLASQVWINANASPYTVQASVMIGIALLISTFVKLGGKRGRYSAPEVLLYSCLTILLCVAFLMKFMPMELMDLSISSSAILKLVKQYQRWIIISPVFIMVFFGIYGNQD